MARVNGLIPQFGNIVGNVINEFQDSIHNEMLQSLQFAGETFVNAARTNNTYVDDTGNLRSSIGYVILLDGKIINQSFVKQNGSDGDTGKLQGMEFAKEVADQYPDGYVLIGVAGMQYAASVEAHGYDVITGGAEQVETLLKSVLNEI